VLCKLCCYVSGLALLCSLALLAMSVGPGRDTARDGMAIGMLVLSLLFGTAAVLLRTRMRSHPLNQSRWAVGLVGAFAAVLTLLGLLFVVG
jgi:hypothetical protein